MGDLQGHPFRGNQWTDARGGAGAGQGSAQRGDWKEEPRRSERLPDGTLADERSGGQPPRPGESFIVYRLGRSTTTDLHGNAGNAEGVARHLTNIDDYDSPSHASGDAILAFRVVVDQEFGGYEGIVAGRGRDPNLGPLRASVGRVERDSSDSKYREVAYSFPDAARSHFKATLIESVPLSRVREVLASLPGSYKDFDESGSAAGADAIRAAFKKGKRGR